MKTLRVGAATVDISPMTSQFLFGYPHVERYSTGIHDPLQSHAVFFSSGKPSTNESESATSRTVLFIANDVIRIDKSVAREARERIRSATGVQEQTIMITATHTHSAPNIVRYASNMDDPVVPPPDPKYVRFLTDSIVAAGIAAVENAVPASVGFAAARAEGVGSNRRSVDGPSDPEVPVVVARDENDRAIACMLVYSMHPTVLHEDSKLVSGDFPAFTRRYLCSSVFGREIPIAYHTGTAGNQSPRHMTRENTFAEAERLGNLLGRAVEKALKTVEYSSEFTIGSAQEFLDLPRKVFPDPAAAAERLARVRERFEKLAREGAPRQEIRTAETDVFGAEEVLTLANAAARGVLDEYYEQCLPAEVHAIRLGLHTYIGWPGELFVEYGLELKRRFPSAYGITLANGGLQGYVVTEAAAAEGGYEASNTLFDWRSGPLLVDAAVRVAESAAGG
ncbi:MAG: hypothetical protein EA426_14095 [Spirochaetaceae bacterium]|nr:MAG: hypothetical protein EA426_14095 [Spirochaetaceae bacterium]